MNFGALFQRAGKVAAENSPAILTAIGVTGTLTTAYLAARGAFKAAEILREEEAVLEKAHQEDPSVERGELDFRSMFELTFQVYIPAATCAALTVTAIVCANRVSERKAAAIASAYMYAEKNFKEYREKTLQKAGKKKEQEIRDEIVQDRITANPPGQTVLTLASQDGSQLCWDKWTDRYFVSDMESIRKAVNDFNQELINSTYLSLSEFYHLVGLRPTAESDNVGWDTDKLLEVDYSAALTDKGVAVIAIDFRNRPSSRIASLY
ncbi:hypothetical protein SEA_MADAMATO_48 [Streptomyces phage Madamato]|nr:hypothetical protein SEA_MADAMATO_48 [Streptomyces phage Madamato]